MSIRDPYENMDATMAEKVLDAIVLILASRVKFCEETFKLSSQDDKPIWAHRNTEARFIANFIAGNNVESLLAMHEEKYCLLLATTDNRQYQK